ANARSVDMHADQVNITVPVAQALIDDQFPHWRGLPITPVAGQGTVNAILRLGDGLSLRFPLLGNDPAAVAEQLCTESTWLPGTVATNNDPADSGHFARDLAEFIREVRAIPTGGATFDGAGRGGVLSAHDDWMQTCFERSHGLLDVPRLRDMWADMRQLPRGPEADVMSHRDVMPGNVLVSNDLRLAGVLDVGSLGPADPALDLVGAWHLLNNAARQTFR
ncbi:aminoglycoside phosphotransferase family protein, partial [Aduncisulcus paluster]